MSIVGQQARLRMGVFMPSCKQQGSVLLGVLLAIACLGLVLSRAELQLATTLQREREQQLLFAGDQIKNAIAAYYRAGGGAGGYPQSLEDLVSDKRTLQTQHFLRRLYLDPMTDSPDWGLLLSGDGRITGVYSKSKKQPLKQSGFPAGYEGFADQKSYRGWVFVVSNPA
jgi:type II secretory pathway pseudopilin PulG